jgi:hypothetical protein
MTMAEILSLTERYGWWIVVLAYALVKGLPIVLNRLWPEWVSAQRDKTRLTAEAQHQDQAAVIRVYEKFVTSLETMTKFVGSATSAINGMERALDENTRTLTEMVEAVKRGPRCPLPECPYWGGDGETEKAG